MVSIARPAFTTADYQRVSGYSRRAKAGFQWDKAARAACPRPGRCKASSLLKFFPFVTVISTYDWRESLLGDVIAGISVGVINIPQGLGFALLASVPAVYGLYTSFFPVLLYFLFGTSRHISFGTMAVTSLLIGVSVSREVTRLGLDSPVNGTTAGGEGGGGGSALDDVDATRVGVACAVTLLAGVMQILMGVCRLGVLASFMSPPFISGFLTGTGCHIVTSQVTSLLGLKIRPISGVGKIPLVAIEVAKNVAAVNVADVLITVFCIALLVGLKEGVNRRYARYLKAPIPAELIVVAVGILASHFGAFHERFGVRVVGDIPRGLPAPGLPRLRDAPSYLADGAVMALLSFVVSISMAKMFSRKHGYEIDANQELLAYGIANVGGAFFRCFACAQAPPRSLVQEGVGGRTQVASLFSCGLVLLVLLAAAPLFGPLPISVLACVLVVAVIPLFYVLDNLRHYWRVSRYDFAVWAVTCLTVTLVDITIGLVVGMLASLLTVVVYTRLARGILLGRTASASAAGIYAPQRHRSLVKAVRGTHIFHYPAPLYFANVDSFKQQLFAATVDPRATLTSDAARGGDILATGDIPPTGDKGDPTETVILDCSAVTHVDSMALQLLRQLAGDYDAVDIRFVLCCCSDRLLIQLQAAGIVATDMVAAAENGAEEHGATNIQIYPTVHDAVVATESHH